ncbi:MAG: ABC transporter ATP-binding protein [Ktedonobacteraceae bacterium]
MYLQIKQLNKTYGTRTVVSTVDLTMEEGEILSLLGPSGCGKTTILRMIAGLVRPDSGLIRIGDRVLYDGKHEMPVEERDLGMVFQDYALWPHMTVAKNIAFGMRLRRMPARIITARIQELLDLVNLSGFESRYPYQLSGGQQQRVAVARALSTEPRIILLDEPLSSLDTALREVMSAELVRLFKRLRITTINVTHDQNEAMNMSDRIMVLRDGHVQQVGTPTELYLRPTNAFVASFMGPANMFTGKVVQYAEHVALHLNGTVQKEIVGIVRETVRGQLKEHASLLCRPDDIFVHQELQTPRHANLLAGTVSHSSFVGGRWRTLVAVGDEKEYNVLAFAPSQLQLDQQVWLELPPERCQIVPE